MITVNFNKGGNFVHKYYVVSEKLQIACAVFKLHPICVVCT